jgi:isoquinoline 1-oxidoreductase
MITNPRMAEYRVPRFSDMPKIEAVLIDRKDVPSAGAGETPIMCIAPAIGNAIFDAANIRLRSMPMVPDGLKG